MGKLSATFTLLLMINVVGYILMYGVISEGLASTNMYSGEDSLLLSLYTPKVLSDNSTIFVLDNESNLYQAVPQQTPSSLIQEGVTFVDRIFVIFGFVQIIIGVLFFPVALVSFMGLPWELSMLLFAPLTLLYVLGLIDLLTGGQS